MDISKLPEHMRRRITELESRPTAVKVRDFLGGHIADAVNLNEVRADLREIAMSGTYGLERDLRAMEEFLAESHPPGLLSQIVAWDANWVLDDESDDEAAAAFLRGLADMLREVIEEFRPPRPAG